MTDEERAEEYAQGRGHEHYHFLFEEHAGNPSDFAKLCYKDGYQDGFNADRWHYPSRGEYPPMDKKVYLWTKGDDFPVVAKRHDFKRHDEEWSWDCYWGSGFILKHNDERIIAWQYIEPPKEEKELYEQELEEAYEQEQEEYEKRMREELLQNYDFDRGDVKY